LLLIVGRNFSRNHSFQAPVVNYSFQVPNHDLTKPNIENSFRTNREEILSSVNLSLKNDKAMLKQKLNILGKILSKGGQPANIRKSNNDISYSYRTEAGQNRSSNMITDNSYLLLQRRKQVNRKETKLRL